MLETGALDPPQIGGGQSKNVGKGVIEHDLNPNWNNDFIGDIGEEKTSLLEYYSRKDTKPLIRPPKIEKRKNHSTPLALCPSPVFYFYTTLASNSLILKLLSCPMITSHVPIGIRLTLVFDIPIVELHVFTFNLLQESKLTCSFQSTMFQNSAYFALKKFTTSNPFALTSEAPKK